MLSLRSISNSLFISLIFAASAVEADPWHVHKRNIIVYEKKIAKHNDEINAGISKKYTTDDPKEMKAVLDSIKKSHDSLTEQYNKREKELKHMRFRHPEKGQEFERRYYRTYRLKSLEDYENERGLRGKLSRIKEKVKKHYGIKTEKEILEEKHRDKLKESIERPMHVVK